MHSVDLAKVSAVQICQVLLLGTSPLSAGQVLATWLACVTAINADDASSPSSL